MAEAEMGQTSHQQLYHMVENASDVLYEASTVFPFVLFPDSITIDRNKATIIQRTFFQVSEANSIQIEDILNVETDTGPFFGTVKLWSRFFTNKPLTISFLKRADALICKQILQGYAIARHKQIECSEIPVNYLVPMLRQLGGSQAE